MFKTKQQETLPHILAKIAVGFRHWKNKREEKIKKSEKAYTLAYLDRKRAGWTLFKAQMVHRNRVNGLEN